MPSDLEDPAGDHRQRIAETVYRKLGTQNRTHAVAVAICEGVVSPENKGSNGPINQWTPEMQAQC